MTTRKWNPGDFAVHDKRGAGMCAIRPLVGEPPAVWPRVRRAGERVALWSRSDDAADEAWEGVGGGAHRLPAVAGFRLFATGTLHQAFRVEFDRLTVAPLPTTK